MLSKLYVCLVIFCFGQCYGVIYQLNDTEYERLPPLFALEKYESCIENPGGVYCVANLELHGDEDNEIYYIIKEYSKHTMKHYNYTIIDRGVCLTKSCEQYAKNNGLDINMDSRTVLEGCLNETLTEKYNLTARVDTISCDTHTEKDKFDIDLLDCIVLGLFVALIGLALFGTICDVYSNGNNEEQNYIRGKDFLLNFSLIQNYNALRSSLKMDDPRLTSLSGVHCIRTILTWIVIYAHAMLIIATSFTADPHTFEKMYEFAYHRTIFSSLYIVQIYFVLSGFFMTFLLQIAEETKKINWNQLPTILFQRWWRLTPSTVVLIAFMGTWLRHLSYGPIWKTVITRGPVAHCRRFFWAHIFYFNNYLAEDTLCAFQTWQIASDMQVFILGIIVHFVIKDRSAKFKIIALSLLMVLGIIIPLSYIWLEDAEPFALQTPELHRTLKDTNFRFLNIRGHNNIICYVIGMSSGYLLHHMLQKKVDLSHSKIAKLLYWNSVPLLVLVMYCGGLFLVDGERPSLGLRMLYAATNRVILGAISVIWLAGGLLKFDGIFKRFLEWPGWLVPSRLSYCVYLVHVIPVHMAIGVRGQLSPVSMLHMHIHCIGITSLSYAVALPLYLLVEAPANRLLKANNEIDKAKSD